MYLDDYHCAHDRVQLVLKTHDYKNCDTLLFHNPQQIWDNISGKWEKYSAEKAGALFQAAVGSDLNFEGYNEDERTARLTFTRGDGYQVAIIKFLMEG